MKWWRYIWELSECQIGF